MFASHSHSFHDTLPALAVGEEHIPGCPCPFTSSSSPSCSQTYPFPKSSVWIRCRWPCDGFQSPLSVPWWTDSLPASLTEPVLHPAPETSSSDVFSFPVDGTHISTVTCLEVTLESSSSFSYIKSCGFCLYRVSQILPLCITTSIPPLGPSSHPAASFSVFCLVVDLGSVNLPIVTFPIVTFYKNL